MSVYAAPVRDMLFAMHEIGGLESICSQSEFEDLSSSLVEAVLNEAARYAADVLDPLNRSGDAEGASWKTGDVTTPHGFREAWQSFTANGWNSMPAPRAWGGQGLPVLVSTAVFEMWKSTNLAFSLCQMLTLGAIEAIQHHASEELKRRFLLPMVEGRWTGTMNLTEPQAGSDVAAIRTRAVPEGEAYRITGNKIFISWGEHDLAENIVHLVLARLPGAPSGIKGISLFLCPKFIVNDDGSLGARNDLACTAIEHKMGIHASPTASMAFGDNGGALGYLIGKPHEGMACMFTMMNHARLNVGLEGVGLSERAYQRARSYALQRVQGTPMLSGKGTIAGHPDVRRMLVSMKARTEAARALAYFCAGQMDRAARHRDVNERTEAAALVALLTPIVKGWCTEIANAVASDGVQVHGGMGYVEESGAAQYLRDARITTIYEGTTGIQANDLLGRKVARDEGRAIRALIERIRADAARLHDIKGDPTLAVVSQALGGAVTALEEGVTWILSNIGEHPERCAAGAVDFLRLSGTVIAGWLHARLAEAALAQIRARSQDTEFLSAKPLLALHFATQDLVAASALRDTMRTAWSAVSRLSEEQL